MTSEQQVVVAQPYITKAFAWRNRTTAREITIGTWK